MSEDINNVALVGRLTRDAELKYTNSGTAVCKISLAVNRSVKRGENWEDEASFFDVTVWGRRGEALAQYLQKGTRIAVAGSLQQDRWEKDGQKFSRVGINAQSIQLLGEKRDGQQQNNQGYNNQQNRGYQNQQNNQGSNQQQFEDDIPF